MKIKVVVILNIVVYFLILIQGKHLGGVLFLYFVLGLYFFTKSSLFMLLGSILFGFALYTNKFKRLKLFVPIASLLYYLGLFYFFYNDQEKNNFATFEHTLSLFTIGLFLGLNIYLNFRIFKAGRIK